ncbi:sensor histidine kinase [Salinarimonas soli]|uniref:histidine kinase n=1 Tax=Salinarimonas soli TaxID=1638099 RepID=A0A5B2VIU4_9HYPH|nr:HAMP domain-containing sensor histidine kinase [Salinarimonas soli]KAA2238117.1 HAMP domain-containing histidine kinase [Salinarimonas soli]
MRIRSRVALVGGIPITVAAAIAVVAWLLLGEADRARSGAAHAGSIYRDLLGTITERNTFIGAVPASRSQNSLRFEAFAASASIRLRALQEIARDTSNRAVAEATDVALVRYREQMRTLADVTAGNDRLIAEMANRAEALIRLTDQARERQHASNSDIIASLAEGDRKLRIARDVVDHAHELRAAIGAVALDDKTVEGAAPGDARRTVERQLTFSVARMRNSAGELVSLLRNDGRETAADTLEGLIKAYEGEIARWMGDERAPHDRGPQQRLADWAERTIKINATEYRALHEEVAQLLTYSVSAAETEQATQNIAIGSLKLSRRSAEALAGRDVASVQAILDESRTLSGTVSALPISPLIQTAMVDAIASWRDGLATTGEGLRRQNGIISEMDSIAVDMIDRASRLNDIFAHDADRIGQFVRKMLAFGAAVGLLLGAFTAFLVARSITEPLKRLQERMLRLAEDPAAGPIPEASRRDELGAMARAANFFVLELGRRENELRKAKNRADATLLELRETQASLIQAEKLGSLGQLVAGVAHEINTPLGLALTMSTSVDGEVQRFAERSRDGRLTRSDLNRLVQRLTEGSKLLLGNLVRAIDLVQSFKQVAADQASGEARRFEIAAWLGEILTSLGPALRKTPHQVSVSCPPDIVLETYPGALAQVVTNLIMNAVTHAFPGDRAGFIEIKVTPLREGMVRMTFRDDGVGVSPANRARLFDPFFTTRRDKGSTGLGLHIVYNLVTASLQGSIAVESEPGRGTTFIIDLPLRVKSSEPDGARAGEPVAEGV